MTRRTQPCVFCPGRTRHDDQRCSSCRTNPFARLPFLSSGFADAAVATRDLQRTFDQVKQVLAQAEKVLVPEPPSLRELQQSWRDTSAYFAGLNPAFNAAAAHMRTLGYDVVNPADNGADPHLTWRDYLALDLKQLVDCDAVATLPGWLSSRGACLEVHVARCLGIPVKPLHDWPALNRPQATCGFPDCRYDARPGLETCELHNSVAVFSHAGPGTPIVLGFDGTP